MSIGHYPIINSQWRKDRDSESENKACRLIQSFIGVLQDLKLLSDITLFCWENADCRTCFKWSKCPGWEDHE